MSVFFVVVPQELWQVRSLEQSIRATIFAWGFPVDVRLKRLLKTVGTA